MLWMFCSDEFSLNDWLAVGTWLLNYDLRNMHNLVSFHESKSYYLREECMESHLVVRKNYFCSALEISNFSFYRLFLLFLPGSGSAPLLCELLLKSFGGWDSNHVVWDMLAFVYSRTDMVHDALVVLTNMKDLNIRPSIMTYNSLLHNLRETDRVWDFYSELEDNGLQPTDYTYSIFLDGLCRQSLVLEAINFLREINKEVAEPCVVCFNTLMSGFCRKGLIGIAKSLFCMMFKYGLTPDRYNYNILIHGLCVSGPLEEALAFQLTWKSVDYIPIR